MGSPWLPLLYQYGVGGILLFGTIIIALRTGGAQWAVREDKRTIQLLIAGYFVYLAGHAFWIWRASA